MSNWIRSGFYSLLEKGVSLVFALGTAMILLRALSKDEFAAWGIFLLATYFVDIGRIGLVLNGLMTFWAQEPRHRPALSSAAFQLNLLFALLTNLIFWPAASWIGQAWKAPQIESLAPVYMLTNIVMSAMTHFNFVQQATGEFRGIFWSTFFSRGVLFFWVAYCWFSGRVIELPHLAWAMLAGATIGAAASWVWASPHLSWALRGGGPWMIRLVQYGKYVLGTNLNTMFIKNIDKLLLGRMLGPASFAIYDAAGKITQMIETPSFSVAAVVFPHSAQRMADEGPQSVGRLYEKSVAAVLAMILPLVVFSIALARPLVWLFAGESYADSAAILQITALFGIFLPFNVQFGTVLDSTGRPAHNFGFTLLFAIVNGVFCYLMIDWLGIIGAALGILSGNLISFVFLQRYLYRHYGIRWWRAFLSIPEMYRHAWGIFSERVLRKRV